MNRWAKRVDANLAFLVGAARAVGLHAHVTNSDWDMTLQLPGAEVAWLVEVKDGGKSASRRVLTPKQIELHKEMKIHVITGIDDLVLLAARIRGLRV